MFFMWIVPLLLVGFVAYAISGNRLVTVLKLVAARTCPQCNQAMQNDWKNCPHCGQTL